MIVQIKEFNIWILSSYDLSWLLSTTISLFDYCRKYLISWVN